MTPTIITTAKSRRADQNKDKPTLFSGGDNTQLETTELSIAETSQFRALEEQLDALEKSFSPAALALLQISELKLYRTFGTWEQYVEQRWGWSRSYGHRLQKMGKVIRVLQEAMAPNGYSILPVNEAQVRPLSQLPEEQWVKTWKRIVKKAKETKITAKLVEDVVGALASKDGSAPKSMTSHPEMQSSVLTQSRLSEFAGWVVKAKECLRNNETNELESLLNKMEDLLKHLTERKEDSHEAN